MNKIKKNILISISLFLAISFFAILIKYKSDILFLVKNAPTIIHATATGSYDKPFRTIDVLEYNLDLEIFQREKRIKENAIIKLKTLRKTMNEIELDFYDSFKINFVKLDGKEASYKYNGNKILVERNNFTNDTIMVEINFEGKPENLGFGSFWIDEINGRKFLTTLNEPVFASTWFPCNDVPHDKALFRISITNDSSMVSVSNGVLEEIATVGNKRTYSWSSVYPIATYSVALYSGEYQKFSQMYYSGNDSMNIDYYVTKEKLSAAKKDFVNHPKYLAVLSSLFGEYPFFNEKYGVAEMLWQQGAMETQTITGIGSNFISGLGFNEAILIHELAHHWWGNSVTLKSWKDVWLNEGFATYSEALYFEVVSGKSALISTMHNFASKVDSKQSGTLYNPGINLFSSNVYNKGAWVLHMLRKEIGDSLFFSGIKSYYQEFKYGNAGTRDLKEFFEVFAEKSLDKFFEQWVYKGVGIPELEIGIKMKNTNSKNYNLEIKIAQKQDEYKNYNFPLDIDIEDSIGTIHNFQPYIVSDTILTFRIKEGIREVFIDKNNWLLASINYLR